MRKRQFGIGRLIDAASLNTAQDYAELNSKEIAMDGRIQGVISGCSVYPDSISTHTIIISPSILRTLAGERIIIPYNLNLILEPTSVVTSTEEFWLTVFVDYAYNLTLPDTDIDGVPYYKQYDNWFVISVEEGLVTSTGLAIKPAESSTGLVVCDILYNSALISTGLITSSDIDTSRQERNSSHYHNNFLQLELITDGLHETRITNPHSVTKSQVGLGNVTNNAQVIKTENSTIGNIPTWATSTGDYLTSTGYFVESTLIGSTSAIADSHAVKTYVDSVLGFENAFIYVGDMDCSTNPNYPAANSGDLYEITSSGLIGGISGKITSTGDIIVCLGDDIPSGDEASVGKWWIVLQGKNSISVTGIDKSTFGEVAKFITTDGRSLTSSGFISQNATTSDVGLVQLSDSYTGTSSGLAVTEKALSNGLAQWSNVTNDAQLKREAGDYITFDYKEFPINTDIILVETSSTGLITSTGKYKLGLGDIVRTSDPTAIHKTSTGELYSLIEKVVLVDDDELLIEDSDDSFIKKKVLFSSLVDKFYVSTSKTIYVSSTGDIGELSITSTGPKIISITTNLDYLSSYPISINTWVATGSLPTATYGVAGAGVQNAALCIVEDAVAYSAKFDGSTWSNASHLSGRRTEMGSAGLQNSALSFGGIDNLANYLDTTSSYNGSSWTDIAGGDLLTNTIMPGSSGIQNSALCFGGAITGPLYTQLTEKFNGATWSTNAGWNLTAPKFGSGGCGVQSATLSFGGATSTGLATTEKFNGSAWSTNSSWNLNVSRAIMGKAGTQNAALSFGGYYDVDSSFLYTTEKFHGSAWAQTSDLLTCKQFLGGTGLQNSALEFCGYTTGGTPTLSSSKFNEPYKLKLNITAIENTTDNTSTIKRELSTHQSNCSFTIQCPAVISYGIVCEREFSSLSSTGLATSAGLTFLNYGSWSTDASWNLNTARNAIAGCGLQHSTLSIGGYTGSVSAAVEKFDGSVWSNTTSLSSATLGVSATGILNASLEFGGTAFVGYTQTTEKFNGSTWNATGNLNTARSELAGAGVQNAALALGGYNGISALITVEKFNGTIWSYTGNMNIGRKSKPGGIGLQNAALCLGGSTDITATSLVEKFNGNTWISTGSLNTAKCFIGESGVQNAALSFGGNGPSATTEKFNGSSWIITNSLNIARYNVGGSGTQTTALSFGGYSPTYSAVTEKFNYNADISELFSTEDCYVDKSNVTIEY